MAFKANGGDDLSVIIDANPQVGRDLAVFARGRRVSPDPPIGVTLWWVVRGSEHEKSLVMQEN